MTQRRHIGLIAGGGQLPYYVAQAARAGEDDLTIVTIEPNAHAHSFDGAVGFPLTRFGKMLKHMSKAGVTHICMAGTVKRPDFGHFKPDLAAMRYLPGTLKAARNGDDALLRHVMGIFEEKGFQIVSAQALCESLLLQDGPLGLHTIEERHKADALLAMQVVATLGKHDIGQGAVVAAGVVLAVEAQEGTDAMLARVAEMDPAIRGNAVKRIGVLAKRPKPGQDMRVDLPTLGPKTVELASEAGLAGIIAESGKAFVIERERTISLADQAGLFIVGLPNGAP